MLRDLPVRDLMITDVLTFTGGQNVQAAMRCLVENDVDAGPVIDGAGKVVGMFSTGDVIAEEARLHFPTIVNFLGVNVALPWRDKELDQSVAQALGEFVSDVMTTDVVTVGPRQTIEDAATLMHDHHVSRLPVVDSTDRLVGLLSRGDIVRAIVLGVGEPPGSPDEADEADDTVDADDRVDADATAEVADGSETFGDSTDAPAREDAGPGAK